MDITLPTLSPTLRTKLFLFYHENYKNRPDFNPFIVSVYNEEEVVWKLKGKTSHFFNEKAGLTKPAMVSAQRSI